MRMLLYAVQHSHLIYLYINISRTCIIIITYYATVILLHSIAVCVYCTGININITVLCHGVHVTSLLHFVV